MKKLIRRVRRICCIFMGNVKHKLNPLECKKDDILSMTEFSTARLVSGTIACVVLPFMVLMVAVCLYNIMALLLS